MHRGDLATLDAQKGYLTYVANVSDFAQANTWASVMLFDHAFRKLQAKDSLAWDDVSISWRLAFFHLEVCVEAAGIINIYIISCSSPESTLQN